jgi:hypothetical protein
MSLTPSLDILRGFNHQKKSQQMESFFRASRLVEAKGGYKRICSKKPLQSEVSN